MNNVLRFLGICFLALVTCALARKYMASELWWFGLPFSVLFMAFFENIAFRGARKARELGHERLRLNFEMANKREPIVLPARRNVLVFFGLVTFALAFGLRSELELSGARFLSFLRPEEPVLRVEFPSFAEKKAMEFKLRTAENIVALDTGSYLSLRIQNKTADSTWMLRVSAETLTTQPTPLEAQLKSTASWSTSVSNLYDKLHLPAKATSAIRLVLTSPDGDTYTVKLEVTPIPAPQVNIEPQNASEGELRSDDVAKILFDVSATSQVPLQTVELAVRTKSGYRFSKTLAEFANNSELEFQSSRAEIITSAIPFAENDVLYVKAVAKTVMPGLMGESRELEYKVQSRQQVRAQVMKLVSEALEAFKNDKEGFDKTKQDILAKLANASELAAQLGLRSPTKRRIADAQALSNEMASLKDKKAKTAQEKLESILQNLKKEQSLENMANLYARLQSMRQAIPKANGEEMQKLAADAETLEKDAAKLKEQLSGVIASPEAGLTLEEKQTAQRLVQLDNTPERIGDIARNLRQSKNEPAVGATNQAMEELQNHLGGAAQILMQARSRAIREAREKLTAADRNLEDSRSKKGEQQGKELREGQKNLDGVPRLGREFDSAMKEARDATAQATEKNRRGENRDSVEQSTSDAQDAIVRALAALQDEEEAERSGQRELEEKSSRTAMHALEGQYDIGWRKKILDDIARLRSQGEPSDSPLIKYLESRLR